MLNSQVMFCNTIISRLRQTSSQFMFCNTVILFYVDVCAYIKQALVVILCFAIQSLCVYKLTLLFICIMPITRGKIIVLQ